jgi:3-hydroxybutyryl-CoA dehydrogenase
VEATREIRSVAVLGTGIMGPGIAQTFGVAGLNVTLIGRREEGLSTARRRIETSTSEHLANGLLDAAARDRCHSNLSFHTGVEAAADADLVIEAITEDIALKLRVFGDLSDVCRPDTVLASSSGHPMSELDNTVANPGRAIALHFWNPPDRLPLVEVCPSPRTDPAVTDQVESLLYAVGKRPVRIRREIDGFIANRLQFALWREAINLWASGVASPEDIDAAATASFGRRLAITGPIATAELGGLRTFRDFAAFVFPSLDTSDRPPQALEQLLGNNRSLLAWTPEERKAVMARRDAELLRHLREDRVAH